SAGDRRRGVFLEGPKMGDLAGGVGRADFGGADRGGNAQRVAGDGRRRGLSNLVVEEMGGAGDSGADRDFDPGESVRTARASGLGVSSAWGSGFERAPGDVPGDRLSDDQGASAAGGGAGTGGSAASA